MNFELWLEFEEVDPNNWDIENEFANIHIDLPDGRHYGIKCRPSEKAKPAVQSLNVKLAE